MGKRSLSELIPCSQDNAAGCFIVYSDGVIFSQRVFVVNINCTTLLSSVIIYSYSYCLKPASSCLERCYVIINFIILKYFINIKKYIFTFSVSFYFLVNLLFKFYLNFILVIFVLKLHTFNLILYFIFI